MPPFIPRRRRQSPAPDDPGSYKGKGKEKPVTTVTTTLRKPTLFDDLDAGTSKKRTAEDYKAALAKQADDESDSSLSEEEFEDVPCAKRQRTEEPSDNEDIEFEDVPTNPKAGPSAPLPTGDLDLTLVKDTRISLTKLMGGDKKGPSKIERGLRIATHQMHVQLLMFHNAIRNAWLCDQEVQALLVSHLSPMAVTAVELWRRDSGLMPREQETPKDKGKGKGKNTKGKKMDARSQRDWGQPAQILENGAVNMSAGDPILKLLKVLSLFWKNRFRISAPGLRKLGYMSLERLDDETKSFSKDAHDPEIHGERIRDINEFRKCAQSMEGSRDVSAQLFTALLRGLGIEARMVASLQPVGFGWGKDEEALEKNPRKLKKETAGDEKFSEDESAGDERPSDIKGKPKAAPKSANPAKKPTKRKSQGSGQPDAPIDLSDSELSNPPSEDDDSVIDVTPAKQRRLPSLPYDKGLLFPHYWTEVLSPVLNTYTAVDPIVLHVIATSEQLLAKFEPRGAKSDKAKQVTCYIVGHSPDGTAKDVTTRYLKRQQWPGRTKGNRLPVEKIAVRNAAGKVKRYEEYDWFKTVMSGYVRGHQRCPRTGIDDQEDATDLKPVKIEKKAPEEGKESLQSYKASPEFVLERHLKREEALLPNSEHVKTFSVKTKGQEAVDEKVYRRKDVVNCKTMETWHKEGRAPRVGEQPLKRVPYRAATTNRRRELAEAEHATGEKMLQGLYSWDQTDWIIPPPIENGVIPKNSFGNIDLYVDSMLPEGAAHIPRRGTVKICKRLEIDYAEAVVGFEFGHRMAVPVINGVVIAIENYEAVMELWEIDEAERVRKEDEKRTKNAIGMWRRMLMGMRIIERVQREYGHEGNGDVDANPFNNRKKAPSNDAEVETQRQLMQQRDEEMAGGFLPEGHDAEEPGVHHSESFFPVAPEDDDDGGGFVVEEHDAPSTNVQSNEEDSVMQDTDHSTNEESAAEETPAPKKRGRPSILVNKSKRPPKTRNTLLPAKASATQKKTTATTKPRKEAPQESFEPEEEEDDEDSPPTEPDSEFEEASEKVAKRITGRRVTLPAKASTPRTTPKRKSARKSATPLKSRYFQHSDDDED